MGVGLLFSATVFVVLAPLPPSLAGHALGFLVFVRNLGSLIGIVIGSTVLNNQLGQRLPQEFLQQVPGGLTGAYSAIPAISFLYVGSLCLVTSFRLVLVMSSLLLIDACLLQVGTIENDGSNGVLRFDPYHLARSHSCRTSSPSL